MSFIVLLGPREQFFQQLIIGISFNKENAEYIIKLGLEETKNRKPVVLVIPTILTKHYYVYQ